MKPAPIQLSREAEQFLRESLERTRQDMEPALVWTPVSHGWDMRGRFLGGYEGPRVTLGWYKKEQRPRDSFFDVCGHAVSIMPSTLEHIEGRMISYEKIEFIFEAGPQCEYVLKVG